MISDIETIYTLGPMSLVSRHDAPDFEPALTPEENHGDEIDYSNNYDADGVYELEVLKSF